MNTGEHMCRPAIVVSPTASVVAAMKLLKDRRIRRLPVVEDGALVGIVSERDLLRALPSAGTTLSVWEIPELLERLLVQDVMTREVVTVNPTTPIQDAAQLLIDHRIGGLPVVDGNEVVGVITETDIFRVFCTMFAPAGTAAPS